MKRKPFGIRENGLTLVELMIAMALSLLLMGGAISIFISSKQAYQTEDAMSRNQEAGRLALGVLTPHIRSAGYTGCVNLKGITPNVIASPAPAGGFTIGTSILGYEGGSDNATQTPENITWNKTANWVRNTDVLVISYGGECGADLTSNMVAASANVQISSSADCGFQAGEALLITDCEAADLFRATNVTNGAIAHASTQNEPAELSRAYKKNATVMKFIQSTYFIGASENQPPALYRQDLDGATEELVDHVANMQIVYGVDTGDKDGEVDTYLKANAITDWSSVLSVQLSLLVRSDDHAISQPKSVTFDSNEINDRQTADKRLRSIFNASVSLRNRVH
jgi:type IV pilus assembly protein PilW